MGRNRVYYHSEALYVSPNSTGYHMVHDMTPYDIDPASGVQRTNIRPNGWEILDSPDHGPLSTKANIIGLGDSMSQPLKIYHLGEGGELYSYDVATSAWDTAPLTPMPGGVQRTGMTATRIEYGAEERILVVGGDTLIGGIAHPGVEVWEYTPSTDTWLQRADLPQGGLKGCSLLWIGGDSVLIMGGWKPQGGVPGSSQVPELDVYVFGAVSGTYVKNVVSQPLPEGVTNPTAWFHTGPSGGASIFVVTGSTFGVPPPPTNMSPYHDKIWVLDESAASPYPWVHVGELPHETTYSYAANAGTLDASFLTPPYASANGPFYTYYHENFRNWTPGSGAGFSGQDFENTVWRGELVDDNNPKKGFRWKRKYSGDGGAYVTKAGASPPLWFTVFGWNTTLDGYIYKIEQHVGGGSPAYRSRFRRYDPFRPYGSDGSATNNGTLKSAVKQLSRVQTSNYDFTINRTDINQFGHLSLIDSLPLEAPAVGFEFSYLLTDGENERILGLNVNQIGDGLNTPAFKWLIGEESNDGVNFFILTTREGDLGGPTDAINTEIIQDTGTAGQIQDLDAAGKAHFITSVGNGFVSYYGIDASVGEFPTANITVEGFNIKTDSVKDDDNGWPSGYQIPAVDTQSSIESGDAGMKICDKYFNLPNAKRDSLSRIFFEEPREEQISALRPGDITLGIPENSALISDVWEGGASHVQSISIRCDLPRTVVQRLGNQYGFGRSINFPVNITLSVNAVVSELERDNLIDRIYQNPTNTLVVTLNRPLDPTCPRGTHAPALRFEFRKALLESETYGSDVGSGKTVDLTFNTQIGGIEDETTGLFIYGTNGKSHPPYFDFDHVYQDEKDLQ